MTEGFITVAGVGTGSESHLTPEVKDAIKNSDLIFSSSRFQKLIPDEKKYFELKNFKDAFEKIAYENKRALILVSGDVGVYSLLPLVKKFFPDEKIKVLPGISSLQVICAEACELWNDAKILSGHGRELSSGKFLNAVERNRITILFCDKNISPQWACKELENFSEVEIFIGENLGSSDEKISHGKPCEFVNENFSAMSVVLVRNNDVYKPEKKFLRDKDFFREKNIVMTNENIRAAIISKLELKDASIFWDIGAGSGSISISIAHENPEIEIYSIEHKIEAVNLISKNAEKFHVHNIKILHGRAVDVIKNIPLPSHVFIGGSDGELTDILKFLQNLDNNIRIVTACVTLENFSAAYDIMKGMKNFEAVQISVTSSKSLTSELTLMSAKNPVMILSANTK